MFSPGPRDFDIRFVVPPRCVGQRLDRVLQSLGPGYSRSFWTTAIKRGVIRLDGQTCRPSKVVTEGSEIDFLLSDLERPELLLDPADLGVPAYDDGEVVGFDKPAGLLTHPTGRVVLRSASVLAEMVLGVPLFLVHRLDKYTSGLLLMARTSEVAAELSKRLRDRRVTKTYKALTRTPPEADQFTVDLALDQTQEHHIKTKMMPSPTGKSARTEFSVDERFDAGAMIECRPRTGRKHQIRAHLLSVGAPILGDLLYGPEEDWSYFDDMKQAKHATSDGLWHALHAFRVVVPEWRGGELRIEVPPSGPFAETLCEWRAGAGGS